MSKGRKKQACNHGSNEWLDLYGHEYAKVLFEEQPNHAFQWHIKRMRAEADRQPQIESLNGAVVERISNEEAATLICRFEWLGGMAPSTIVSYGLKLNGRLLGVECFGTGGSDAARRICLPDPDNELRDKTICLVRGACVHFSPRKAPSFLIKHACRKAYEEFGWQIFFAYADPMAGESGELYRFARWHCLGQNIGRNSDHGHAIWLSPTGEIASTYSYRPKAISLGWTEEMGKMGLTKADFLRNLGWRDAEIPPKHKFVHFEGTPEDRKRLKDICPYEFLPFPQKGNLQRAA